MIKARFQRMGIELGKLWEPIAPLCNSKIDTWNGCMHVHLKKLKTVDNVLLEGTQIFALLKGTRIFAL
jgi:hypothetical protein